MPKLNPGGIIFPQVDQADFTGPVEVLSRITDNEVILFCVRAPATRAACVISVCNGALVFGAAGLLKERRCATGWVSLMESMAPVRMADRMAEWYQISTVAELVLSRRTRRVSLRDKPCR